MKKLNIYNFNIYIYLTYEQIKIYYLYELLTIILLFIFDSF